MNLVEHLAGVVELANCHANVRISRHANAHAQLGAALGNLAAHVPMLGIRAMLKTVVVDLDDLVLGLGRQQHLIDIERHARTTRMPKHEHLGVLQGIDVHLGRLGERRALGKLRIMHACHQIIQIARHQFEQRMLVTV